MSINNNEAINRVQNFIENECDATYLVEELRTVYFLLAQNVAKMLDEQNEIPHCKLYEGPMHSIHRLCEVLEGTKC